MFKKRKLKEKLKREFDLFPEQYTDIDACRERIGDIKIYYEEFYSSTSENCIDETTWNELSMDEVFLKINHTRSFVGEQLLYSNMKRMADQINEDRVNYFMEEDKASRVETEYLLSTVGKNIYDYSLPIVLSEPARWKMKFGNLYRILQWGLIALLLIGGLLKSSYALFAALVVGIININIYVFTKYKYEGLLYSLGSIKRIVTAAASVCNMEWFKNRYDNAEINRSIHNMKKVIRKIANFQIRKSTLVMDFWDILRDYIIGAFLYDIVTFNAIINILQNKKEDMINIYNFLGLIDVEIAVAAYRNNAGLWCRPDYDNTSDIISMKKMSHLLLKQGVGNDVLLDKRIVLTGANASGKSTYMKAIAVNCILGQVLNTVMAEEFIAPHDIRVVSCMAMSDDILEGKSYFINELERIKMMMEEADKSGKVLLLFDELLRGTNYSERVAIAEAILNKLKDTNAFVIIATHDIKLAKLIKNDYESYFFDSKVTGNVLTSDYKLQKGVAGNKNAIKLLGVAGFEPAIRKRAIDNIGRCGNEDK